MARPIVLIPYLFRLADVINFRKDYSPPPLVRHLDPSPPLSLSTPQVRSGVAETVSHELGPQGLHEVSEGCGGESLKGRDGGLEGVNSLF